MTLTINSLPIYTIILLLYAIMPMAISIERNEEDYSAKQITITPKIYSSMFIRRREEQKLFVKHLLRSEYEKNYKMLELAFDKIFELINENNATLYQSEYHPKQGFPTDQRIQDSVTLILENSCLAGDIILHLPEISYRVLKKYKGWKSILNWCIAFVNEFPHIIDEPTVKMLDLFKQEINESERSEDFVNPYYEENKTKKEPKKEKRKVKRLKKGPQLIKTEL